MSNELKQEPVDAEERPGDAHTDETQQVNEAIAREKHAARRLESRPSIDHLIDAVAKAPDGSLMFLPQVGQKVVVERVSTLTKNNPWLDTRVWIVNRIDTATGRVDLWCDDLKQNGICNYIAGAAAGYRFKLAPTKGPIFARKHKDTK